MIVEERMQTYINSLDMGNTPFLQELETKALADRVPIIRRDMQSFMRMLLALKQPKRILEVGTAVGFSTLLMCEYGPEDMEIVTIENYEKRIPVAKDNFRRAGRDANQGACTHPCRWKYSVVEEKRPGEYMPVFENERGTFIFNSKDLCMVEHMEDILTSGIDSLKIEGRMKTALYVATVARTYRKAIDDCMESPEKYHANMPWYQEQISNCTYRQFTTGFFYGKPDENTQIYDSNTYVREYTYLGFAEEIDERGLARLTQRNKFSVGETIEIMKPDGRNIPVTVEAIYNEEGEAMESAPHAQQRIYVKLTEMPEVFDILRRGE